ncbi:MAG: hypothetical protein AAB019_02745 [Planctomycetota bacterium]
MLHFSCDRCGKGLLLDEDVRYEVTIEVKSGYDPLEITREDLQKDFSAEIAVLLKQMKKKGKQALEDGVYKIFKFDLCLQCQKEFIKNPLPVKSKQELPERSGFRNGQ